MMSRSMIGAGLLFLAMAGSASAQVFELSADKFRAAYNARLKEDGEDTLGACRAARAQVACHFHNDPFAGRSGRYGRIDLDELMTLDLDGGKLAQITLAGQRSSPAAVKRFMAQVGSAIGALDGSLDKAKIAEIVGKLGLTRGDDAPNIGESMSETGTFGEIHCTNQYGSVSMVIACTIDPPAK